MPDEAAPPLIARTAKVKGRVQGVGFRWSASDEAGRLGVRGWIRNAADGSVEAFAEGSPAAVEAFVSWLRVGPPGARVLSVDVRPAPPSGAYRRFSIES